MIFTTQQDVISCETWDHDEYCDVVIGEMKISEDSDGYYRFFPTGKGSYTARDCKDLLAKLKLLNKDIKA